LFRNRNHNRNRNQYRSARTRNIWLSSTTSRLR
jgi:hypothetical protein